MYHLQQELKKFKDVKLESYEIYRKSIVTRLIELARQYRTDVTLYYDRSGYVVEACQGEATVSKRHLKHLGWNRLSQIRAIKVLAPHSDLLRGRNEIELNDAVLDLMVIFSSDHIDDFKGELSKYCMGVIFQPQFEEGLQNNKFKEIYLSSIDEGLKFSFYDYLKQVKETLGKHQRVLESIKGKPSVLLIGVEFTGTNYKDFGGDNLDELDRLATTADLNPVYRMIQKRRAPAPGTFIGQGKVSEAHNLVLDNDIDLVVFGCDLPYSTIHRLTKAIGVTVIDRSELILKIFARHALTNEGRLQVQLAQLEHSLHRLLKEEKDLDRQAGGIGVRGGPGETAATLIKRRIHRKKVKLERKLEIVHQHRVEGRKLRALSPISQVALAGYTNAGKSTFLNALCKAREVETADKLFTTLTTTTRKIDLPSGRPILLSDTVGFVERLPHHLVAAFESTLAESADADLTLVLIECNVDTILRHKKTVDEVLENLGQPQEKRLPVLTKVDLLNVEEREKLRRFYPGAIEISSHTREGLDELLEVIEALLSKDERELELLVPFEKMALVDCFHKYGRIMRKEWTGRGLRLRARLPEREVEGLKEFIV